MTKVAMLRESLAALQADVKIQGQRATVMHKRSNLRSEKTEKKRKILTDLTHKKHNR